MHFQQDCQVRDGGVDDQDGLDGGFPDFLQVFLYLIVMQCHKVAISSSPSSSPTVVDRPTQLICISDIYIVFVVVNRQIQKP